MAFDEHCVEHRREPGCRYLFRRFLSSCGFRRAEKSGMREKFPEFGKFAHAVMPRSSETGARLRLQLVNAVGRSRMYPISW